MTEDEEIDEIPEGSTRDVIMKEIRSLEAELLVRKRYLSILDDLRKNRRAGLLRLNGRISAHVLRLLEDHGPMEFDSIVDELLSNPIVAAYAKNRRVQIKKSINSMISAGTVDYEDRRVWLVSKGSPEKC